MPPLPNSPAIDKGSDAAANLFATDQRGFLRLVGAHVDLGAVEMQIDTTTASLVVTTTNDFLSDATNNGLSLRSAIAYTEANPTISFAPGLAGATITLSNALTLSSNLTIDASKLSGGITLNGNNATNVFQVNSGATVVLNSLIVTKGYDLNSVAGGINNYGTLTINLCSVSGNVGVAGGGIFNNDNGIMTLNQCTVSGNSGAGGGGIWNFGTLTLNQCTVSGNSVVAAPGGGIYNSDHGTATLNQCTLSGNSSGSVGGGVYNSGGGMLTLNQCTVSANSASIPGAGIYSDNQATALVSNSIVAANGIGTMAGLDIHGGATVGGSNIVQSSASGALTGPPVINANPNLAPLGYYGGPTQTMPPLPGSPAINAGAVTIFTTDQRGYTRVLNAAPDIGAVQGTFNPNAV
jgi:hypothetical protein